MKREKATTFERIDFIARPPAPNEPVSQAPPSPPPRPRPPAPSVPPAGEIPLPKRLDPHDTGRIDTDFFAHQQNAPRVALFIVGATLVVGSFGALFFAGLLGAVLFL